MSWIPKKTVVVPVDFSEESYAAIEEAARLVQSPAALHVIHVLPPFVPADSVMVWEVHAEKSAVSRAREQLVRKLTDAGLGESHAVVRIGDPGSEIAAFADELSAELIVLPSHGRTGLRRLLIGSVAERVIRMAHCPVLVLRNGGSS